MTKKISNTKLQIATWYCIGRISHDQHDTLLRWLGLTYIYPAARISLLPLCMKVLEILGEASSPSETVWMIKANIILANIAAYYDEEEQWSILEIITSE